MAPRTRATSAEAAEQEAEAACLLLDLSHDEVDVVARELCDPLRPLIAVHLSSTAKGLRVPMRAALLELKQQHEEASAFAACWGWTCATLRATTVVALGAEYGRLISLGHWRTLGLLAQTRALPLLEDLTVGSDDNGDEGVTSLAAGLCGGCLPSLTGLYLYEARISLQGVSALAPALTARVLPSLHTLNLSRNSIGDAELAVLAAPLRQLAGLAKLLLFVRRARAPQPRTGSAPLLHPCHSRARPARLRAGVPRRRPGRCRALCAAAERRLRVARAPGPR